MSGDTLKSVERREGGPSRVPLTVVEERKVARQHRVRATPQQKEKEEMSSAAEEKKSVKVEEGPRPLTTADENDMYARFEGRFMSKIRQPEVPVGFAGHAERFARRVGETTLYAGVGLATGYGLYKGGRVIIKWVSGKKTEALAELIG